MDPAAARECAGHEDDLALLVSDDLPAEDAHRLQQHLAHCAGCRTRLDEYRADAAWLRGQRNTTPDVGAGDQLRARIADQIADTPPASWTVAWLHRLFEGATRRGPQPLLAGLAATLLLVGSVGALTHPLDRRAIRAVDSAEVLLPSHRHVDRDLDPADETAFDSDGDDGAEIGTEEPGLAATEPERSPPGARDEHQETSESESEDLAAPPPGAMRIEMKTSDPDVRIIWFAQADRSHGSVKP
jgi:hypothetical protein